MIIFLFLDEGTGKLFDGKAYVLGRSFSRDNCGFLRKGKQKRGFLKGARIK